MSDQDIQKLENKFPEVSSSAFAAARERVLASGQSVLQSQDGVIYEVFPDGRRVEVKENRSARPSRFRERLHDPVSVSTPRMRMFAGPNGSGKSTLKSYLPAPLLGVYLNPDEIEQRISKQHFLDFSEYGVTTTEEEALPFFTRSSFLESTGFSTTAKSLVFAEGRLDFGNVEVNSYFASVAGDFLRQKLLAQKSTFTFETVMSHQSKIELLAVAQSAGYRTCISWRPTIRPSIFPVCETG